jgi:hypothetical protein
MVVGGEWVWRRLLASWQPGSRERETERSVWG